MKYHIRQYLNESARIVNESAVNEDFILSIEEAAKKLVSAIKRDKKIFAVGNGGSACDASHFISELVGKYRKPRDPIAAISLTDAAALTCISNDFGYLNIYSRQLNALGNEGDVLVALSTSGQSQNIIKAINMAMAKKMTVIGICRYHQNDFGETDVAILIDSQKTNHIQEMTIKIIHVLVELIEKELYGRDE